MCVSCSRAPGGVLDYRTRERESHFRNLFPDRAKFVWLSQADRNPPENESWRRVYVCVWRKDKMEREGDWFPCTMSRQAKSHYGAQLASEPDRDWCLFPVVLAIRAQTDDFSPSGSKRVKPAARETTCLRERERCTEYTTIVASCNWKCSFTTVKCCTDNIYKCVFCTWCYQGILM